MMRYKIKKDDSAPSLSVGQLAKFRKCYLGISINNPFFRDEHLPPLLKWMDHHFDECIILIGDYLHRINEKILSDKNDEQAIASCITKGDVLQGVIEAEINLLGSTRFNVIRWKTFLDEHPEVESEKHRLYEFCHSNPEFKKDVLKSCTEYIDKLMQRERIYLGREEAVLASQEYIIEEMAVFSVLIDQGYTVQVYPGSHLQVLKNLANKKFPELVTNLSRGIYVDLTARKTKS